MRREVQRGMRHALISGAASRTGAYPLTLNWFLSRDAQRVNGNHYSVNLNKLFPRLTISAKLAIAFVLLAGLPALAVTAVSALTVAAERRAQAEAMVRYDLDRAELRVARALEEARQTVDLLRAGFVESWIRDGRPSDGSAVERMSALSLGSHRSAVFRIKVYGPDAEPLLEFTRDQPVRYPDALSDNGGLYYVLAAERAGGDSEAVYVPVELRQTSDGAGNENGVRAAVAIVESIRGDDGELLGVVVGEADAELLFADLEVSTPGLEGATALVRQDGLFLFHSEHKREWSSLLATQSDTLLTAELGAALADEIRGGGTGSNRGARHFVEFRPIDVGDRQYAPLTLYRSIPNEAILAPVRAFLARVAAAGALLLVGVLSLAVFAARQLTKPIYRLQQAAHSVADGGAPEPLDFETNDELEDLARDFTVMAERLSENRERLEQTVKQRTKALAITRAELAEVVTHSADAIIGLDAAGKVRLWNEGAQGLFGYEPAEAIGREIDELIGSTNGADTRESRLIQKELEREGAVVNLRTTRRHKDGGEIPVTLTQTIIGDGAGESLGTSLIIRDDRMHAKLEEHMRRSERLSAVSIMAAGLAHEINNPLSILGNRIELMRREASKHEVGPRLVRDIEVVDEKVARIRNITADLLSFAREGQAESVDLSIEEVLRRLVRLLERTLAAQGVEISLDIPEPVPHLRGNATAIETVFANLILNAQQAMPDGGVVRIRASVEGESPQRLVVCVTDDGPGISDDVKARLFEPFFTTKGDRGGTGLGLAVCRALVERQGGLISAGNSSDGGGQFTVHLPLRARDHE